MPCSEVAKSAIFFWGNNPERAVSQILIPHLLTLCYLKMICNHQSIPLFVLRDFIHFQNNNLISLIFLLLIAIIWSISHIFFVFWNENFLFKKNCWIMKQKMLTSFIWTSFCDSILEDQHKWIYFFLSLFFLSFFSFFLFSFFFLFPCGFILLVLKFCYRLFVLLYLLIPLPTK